MPTCNWCDSDDLFVLGVLGKRVHFRCRRCAADCSCLVSDLDEEMQVALEEV